MARRLEGKVAIIVGAGQTPGGTIGNGRAIAQLFGREGAVVECVDLFADRAEETAELIRREGGQAFAVRADVASDEDVAQLHSEVIARHGRIDVLVNNVGILARGDATVDAVELAAYERVMSVNLKGPLLATRAVLPTMREQGGGSIVNISSAAAEWGGYHLAYELSKAGINRLTTSTAQSQARYGVRCNAVMLGLMDTPMVMTSLLEAGQQQEAEVRAARDARVPLGGKMGTGWDAAYPAVFFASDEARFITGAILPVDGGTGVRAML